MGIISVEQADRLYWLGRYVERVYTTIRMYSRSFDRMIDIEIGDYHSFCKKFDIPDIYTDKDNFNRSYPFEESNPDSIISNLNRAYDNAIVLRESIGSETLAYIQLAIYEMQSAKRSESPLIELQRVQDYLMAFWGVADDYIDDEGIRNIIKAGKRIERIDLFARLGCPAKKIRKEVNRMIPRVTKSGRPYRESALKLVEELIAQEETDYYGIVLNVNQIL